ncbi:MAG: preprotein translocase subunit SecG [Candidatus Dadabacteria bacterium]|nr:preprotein translocase subunit SecG [Candidatus Dadabacteria bacterium]
MEFLIPSVKIIHIVVSILLVLIILLQPSKSADIGSMFGGGSSESLFGSSGAMPFLVKMTRLFGLIFVITSLFLGYTSVKSISGSVVEKSPIEMFEETSPPVEEPLEPSQERE